MVIKNNISHMDFEKFDINIKQKTIKIGTSVYPFNCIKNITVDDDMEQPSVMARYFTRTSYLHYFAQINFHLYDGNTVKYKTSFKGQLYKILKTLQPYIAIDDDIERFKFNFLTGPVISGIILCILHYLFDLMHK